MKPVLLLTTLALLSGCSYFHAEPEQQKMLHYTCGTMPLTVNLDNARQEVNLILDGNPLLNPQAFQHRHSFCAGKLCACNGILQDVDGETPGICEIRCSQGGLIE